ncbi:MAG: hypothetical protein CBARDCOR_5735 [uncultured Caballeronia sp.]|nr:MAG: hypothetical protein CBARDCOR_5735 [uncultured Caballeronia sp.]
MVACAVEILATLVPPPVRFVAILDVAMRRDFVRQSVQEHRTWMLQWMFADVHLLESDAVCESWFFLTGSDFSGGA